MLDLTLVTRAGSTLENCRRSLHCLRGPEITLVFDYVVRKSHVIDYVVVEASKEANIVYNYRRALMALLSSKQAIYFVSNHVSSPTALPLILIGSPNSHS